MNEEKQRLEKLLYKIVNSEEQFWGRGLWVNSNVKAAMTYPTPKVVDKTGTVDYINTYEWSDVLQDWS